VTFVRPGSGQVTARQLHSIRNSQPSVEHNRVGLQTSLSIGARHALSLVLQNLLRLFFFLAQLLNQGRVEEGVFNLLCAPNGPKMRVIVQLFAGVEGGIATFQQSTFRVID